MAKAPAMATRLRWPKDSSWMGRSARSSIDSSDKAWATLLRTCAVGRPKFIGPKEMS